MNHREPLPEDCPPGEAEEISVPLTVYRLVRNDPPTDDDFRSQKRPETRHPVQRIRVPSTRTVGVH